MSGAGLVRGDALRIPLRDESVDLIVTSPPYWSQRDYGTEQQIGMEDSPEEFIDALLAVTEECARVLTPTGNMFVNLGDTYAGSGGAGGDYKDGGRRHGQPRWEGSGRRNVAVRRKSLIGMPWRYALGCIDRLGLVLRAEIIWAKPQGEYGRVSGRVRRSHEQVFHITRHPDHFENIDEVREPYADWTVRAFEYERNGYDRRDNADRVDRGGFAKPPEAHPLGKVPGSVWEIATDGLRPPDWLNVDHFAPFPQELPRRFVNGWCPADGVVLDPFAGSGTTVMVARALGRFGVGLDLSADYLRLARWRVFESGHATKALARTNAERQGVLL